MKKKSLLAGLLVVCFVFGIIAVASYALKFSPGKIGLFGKGKTAKADGNVIPDGQGGFIVYPTATYPTDSDNVQWAVNNVTGNLPTVLLSHVSTPDAAPTSFDFGTELTLFNFRVDIQKNCIISGEVGVDGTTPLTKIINGAPLFGVNTPRFDLVDNLPVPPVPPAQASNVIIKNLISNGGGGHFCGAYSISGNNLEINNVRIYNFHANPDYDAVIPLYAQSIGKYTVKDCVVEMVDTAEAKIKEKANAAIDNSFSPGEITRNKIITPGRGIVLDSTIYSTISNNVITAEAGVDAWTLNNSIIKGNTIQGNVSKGITLEAGISLSFFGENYYLNGNTIEANTISPAGVADYRVTDSFWFPNPQGNYKIDLAAYPHTRNNHFLNPLGSGNKMVLVNIGQTTLEKYNIIGQGFNISETTALDNIPPAQGPKFITLYKAYCIKNGGKWDPVNNKCVY